MCPEVAQRTRRRFFGTAGRWGALTAVLGLCGCSNRAIDAVRVVDGPLDAAEAHDAPPPDAAVPDASPGEPVAALPRSCAALLAANPDTPDGQYVIDPDGPGPVAPFEVTCDMRSREGGWTQVVSDDFTKGAMGYSRNVTTMCGGFGTYLGGFKAFGSETISKTVDLSVLPHTQIWVRFDYIAMDSWDSERAFARVDGTSVMDQRCDEGVASTCNQRVDQCGWTGSGNRDGKVPIDVVLPHTRAEVKLEWGAELDQANEDESWALDNVIVFVR